MALRSLHVCWMLSGVLLASNASAQSHRCASVAGAEQRLACYDAEFPPLPSVISAEARSAVDAFGRPSPMRAAGLGAEDAPAALVAVIVRLDYGAGGGRTVVLDNGQTWRISEGNARGVLTQGDQVRVRHGALGSYMLVTAAGVPLRATRLR